MIFPNILLVYQVKLRAEESFMLNLRKHHDENILIIGFYNIRDKKMMLFDIVLYPKKRERKKIFNDVNFAIQCKNKQIY